MNKLISVSVDSLFGIKENSYTINFEQDSNISFLYGFNGIGKTTLLKFIEAAFSGNLEYLNKTKFSTL